MPESARRAAILLGIAALFEIADQPGKRPLVGSWELRALLAMLHTLSDGCREPYDAFWQQARWQGLGNHHASANDYMRSTNMHIQIKGIVRSLGLEPQSMELNSAISAIRAKQRRLISLSSPAA